jgi:hypothetical protein
MDLSIILWAFVMFCCSRCWDNSFASACAKQDLTDPGPRIPGDIARSSRGAANPLAPIIRYLDMNDSEGSCARFN